MTARLLLQAFLPAMSTVLLACLVPAIGAAEPGLKASGFLSVVGGRIYGNNTGSYEGPELIDGRPCPCYIADYSNAGIYTEGFAIAPESRAGLQLKYTVNPQLAAVVQLVVRGSDRNPRLQWAYASYAPSRQLEVQLGRKRIPLYFYSDFQNVGMAYPWVSPPPELYGWEATNFNGISVTYRTELAGTAVRASVFAGRESLGNSLYQRLYYEGRTRVRWENLRGAEFEINRGPLTMRAIYMQTDVSSANSIAVIDERARSRAYGLATNLDFGNWFLLSEVTRLRRDFDAGYHAIAPAFTLGAGYRYGNWTPFINFARYKDASDAPEIYVPQGLERTSLTLRYEIDLQSAFKAQVDRHRDLMRNFGGDATVVRFAYDRVF